MKQDNTWNDGPPPSIGWWPASIGKYIDVYRWWNGKWWSNFAIGKYNKRAAAICAIEKANCEQSTIQWQHRPANWPKRSKT